MKPINIFKAGSWPAMSGATLTFAAADLAATAAAYDPAKHEAPLVVGHPATDDPAYGWVASLSAGESGLEASPRAVDPAFAVMVNEEKFNRISSSFFLPDAPSNPVPGVYYLRHVGFLGAVPPAVAGLRKPSFDLCDEAGSVTVEFSIPVPPVSEVPPVADPSASPASADFATQVATLTDENAALKRQIEQRDAGLAAERAKQMRTELAQFADVLINEGRLLPVDKTGFVEFMAALSTEQTIEFAADGQVIKPSVRRWFTDFARRLPVQVDFNERAAAAADATAGASVDFAVPSGYSVDEQQLAQHRKIQAHANAKGIPYAQALAELS